MAVSVFLTGYTALPCPPTDASCSFLRWSLRQSKSCVQVHLWFKMGLPRIDQGSTTKPNRQFHVQVAVIVRQHDQACLKPQTHKFTVPFKHGRQNPRTTDIQILYIFQACSSHNHQLSIRYANAVQQSKGKPSPSCMAAKALHATMSDEVPILHRFICVKGCTQAGPVSGTDT